MIIPLAVLTCVITVALPRNFIDIFEISGEVPHLWANGFQNVKERCLLYAIIDKQAACQSISILKCDGCKKGVLQSVHFACTYLYRVYKFVHFYQPGKCAEF